MISPNFIRAAKIEPFLLDKPIRIQLAVTGSKSVINYGTNATIKYEGRESKEYFDIINIDYYNAILGTPFLRKHEVIINFIKNCLWLKDKIIHNQANKYKVGEGNPQKNTKNVSMKALKQEEPKIPHKDSKWLSKKPHPRRSDKKDSANCQTQEPVGLLEKSERVYMFRYSSATWGNCWEVQQFIRSTSIEVTPISWSITRNTFDWWIKAA